MGGRMIITIYFVLIPPKRLNFTYLISVLVQIFSCLMLISAHYFPSLAQVLFAVGMTIFGLGRGIYTFPYLLLYQLFNQ